MHLEQFNTLSSNVCKMTEIADVKLIRVLFARCIGRNQCAIMFPSIAIPIILNIYSAVIIFVTLQGIFVPQLLPF